MSRTKTKRYLVLLAAVGLVAAALGGTGTFASFTAETSNNGNYFATGSLLLHNLANGGTTCTSEADPNNANNAAPTNNCTVLFQVPLTGSASTHEATLALTNAGTLDSANISFESPTPGCVAGSGVKATLTAGFASTTTVTSLSITPLIGKIASGYSIVVDNGSNTQTFVASAAVSPGATSIPVVSTTALFTFAATNAVTGGPTFGGGGDLCAALQISIVEADDNTFTHTLAHPALGCAYGTSAANIGCTPGTGSTLTGIPSSFTNLNLASISTSTALTAGQTRYFVIEVTQPAMGNTFQNRSAVFSLRWHAES